VIPTNLPILTLQLI